MKFDFNKNKLFFLFIKNQISKSITGTLYEWIMETFDCESVTLENQFRLQLSVSILSKNFHANARGVISAAYSDGATRRPADREIMLFCRTKPLNSEDKA